MQSFLHISLSAPPVQCQYLQLHKRLLNRPERCSAVASAGANCDTVLPAAATGPSRRFLLQAAFAAPLLLRVACPVAAALAAARVPRPLTPDEAVAVAAALAVTVPPIKAPVMLRLPFHDAGTYSTSGACGGANASVQYELDRPENFGLNRGWSVIKATAERLRGTAAEALSRADLIALAGAHAVAVTGGPVIEVPVGRLDAGAADPPGYLPVETATAAEQIGIFADKGLTVQEMIALAGAHTLGNKGFGEPLAFDNTYYKSLLAKPWLNKSDPMAEMIGLPSDHVLSDDAQCRPWIEKYAADQQRFFEDFAAAYVKMCSLGACWA